MITGCLQQKNGYYYAVLYIKVDGKRKVKWVSTKLLVAEVSERKAKRAFEEIRSQFERQEEERLQKKHKNRPMKETYTLMPKWSLPLTWKNGWQELARQLPRQHIKVMPI